MTRPRHAVVGSGVSGLVAAYALSEHFDVTLFEADHRLGGHADTHDVTIGDRTIAVDTGFIVHNDRTYPTLLRLFDELGIATGETDMSMSVSCPADNIEYAGGQGLTGLLPSIRHLGRPRYLRMLTEVTRFHRAARSLLAAPGGDVEPTLGQFLDQHRLGSDFRRWFMTPLVAAVWSCDPADAEVYPARHLFTFLDHHGMLGVLGSPAWRTVTGGSRTYVEAVSRRLHEVRTGTPVTSVIERDDHVEIVAGGERLTFDAVVLAVHAPAALSLLGEPTQLQRDVLGAFSYSRNTARLHTDDSLLPSNSRARASWNYLVPDSPRSDGVVVTYDMTRLQRLDTGDGTRLLVTLGAEDLIDPAKVLDTMQYEHPLFTSQAVAAQQRVPQIESDRLAFAGAWQGWGFHEDGAASGLRAARRLGATLGSSSPSSDASRVERATRVLPRIYPCTIEHTRRAPLQHRFSYAGSYWLVDLDHLPDHGVAARFEARDHLGDPRRSIRANVDAFMQARGIDLTGGTVHMLAMPRVAGYCFNPISVHWCYQADQTPAGVIVEVHNTYGDRHAYLVHPDSRGNARVDKELYVSPFNDTSGGYRVHVPAPTHDLSIAVTLDRPGQPPFTATLRGEALPADIATVRRQAWRQPIAPLVASARIRRQGISLWRKGLPVQPRPVHVPQPGTSSVDLDRWPDLARPPQNLRTRASAAVAERLLRRAAGRLGIDLDFGDGTHESDPTRPTMRIVRRDDLFARIGRSGLIGFGEAWMAGDWDADDPAQVLTVFAQQMDRLVPIPLQRLRGAYVARQPHQDRGTVDNARWNISRHYDLSNDVFAAFLDPTMTYSSAWFQHADLDAGFEPEWADLEKAQVAKIERLLDAAQVTSGTRLLEIGSGWGELAVRAALRGAEVRTITLSSEQLDFARRRVADAGMSDRVSVELMDYRQVSGSYDAVISVEMIEAVGLDHLQDYFDAIARVLAPGGRVAIQAITMADHRMHATRDTYTWVHKYIFPGGLIPSLEEIERRSAASGLALVDDLRIGAHYAQTLRLWEERFLNHWPQIQQLGFDDTFRRMWQFYLAYSRAGFASGYLDVQQLVLQPGQETR